MRTSLLASAALAFAIVLAAPPATAPASTCGETSCGIPSCWNASVRTRPDIAREVTISCSSVESAKLTSQPAHGTVENVSIGFYTLSFTVHADADSPRYDEATFELTGRDGSIEQKVQIEVIPNSENSPPVCDGDQVTQRSDGSAPVDVYLHPYCRDPDGDDFVIEGGPPGVHPDSPKHVPAGESESNWRYRTATSSGDESTTIWATDSLGARSADARLDVTVGPGIDRLPTCEPSSWSNATSYYPVYSRPGAIRRFGIICTDPDADPFTASLSSPPQDGTLATFDLGAPSYGYWGAERWIDATYVPTGDSTDPDPFSVTASGSSGAGPEAHLAIVPRPPSQNGGGGCGYGPASVVADLPGVVSLSCEDDDGDPLSVEVLSQPDHGVAAPGLVTPGRYGWQDITVPYVPTPGYVGEDCVKIRVADGHGLRFDLALDIDVTPAPPPVDTQPPPVDVGPPPVPPVPPVPATPPDLPPLPDLPGPPGPPGPPDPPAPPTSPTPPLKSAVEEALGTTAVKRVRSYKGAQVWARSRLSRADLTRYGQASGLVVVCSKRCQIRSAAALASGRRSVRSSEVRTVTAALAGQPHVVSLAISPAERRALRLRPTRRARARFTLSVRPSGGPARTLRSSIPVSR